MIRIWGADADPAAQGRVKGAKPVAVLDIGSNSVRLVVYEKHSRALTPLYNEKASCALGRGVAASGRLAEENVEHALDAARRFALVARLMGVGKTHVLATSAVREAANGPEFADKIEQIMQAPVRVLSGLEEAHFAALGVVAGMADFEGVVGDLGGGSLELSHVDHALDTKGETFELGVIRLQDDSGGSARKARALAAERLGVSKLARAPQSDVFCAIGGTWRSLAKLHQRQRRYPLHMIQHYAAPAGDLLKMCEAVVESFDNDGSYQYAEFMSSSRRGLLPFGAAVMAEMLKAGNFRQVVFSALGVREGYLYDQLDALEQQQDPLLQISFEMSLLRARSPAHSDDLIGFSDRFITQSGLSESAAEKRLRHALCYLADIGWRGHPDYRGNQSVDLVAYGAIVGIDHPGRAFLAEALAVRYMGLKHKSASAGLLKLAGSKASARARVLGALLRVAFPLSAGMSGVLPRVGFARSEGRLDLVLPSDFAFLDGNRLGGRLAQLADMAGFADSKVVIA